MPFKGLASALAVTFIVLAVCTPACVLAASSATAISSGGAFSRTTLRLADGWRFHFGEVGNAVTTTQFDDTAWASISVPHTWNRVGYYLPNPASRLNRKEEMNREQGVGWYRLSFNAPPGATGRRAWLQFDAASRIATVWLNGAQIGQHAGVSRASVWMPPPRFARVRRICSS
ncbi:MAG: sugar-binding domain-containing protein [Pseudomonadota bacterium]